MDKNTLSLTNGGWHEDSHIALVKKNHTIIINHSMHAVGRHVFFDVYDCEHAGNLEYVKEIMKEAVIESGATILHENFHSFGKDCGFTGVLVLSESHATVHTWKELGLLTFDIYFCGICDPLKAAKNIIEKLGSEKYTLKCEVRGLFRPTT